MPIVNEGSKRRNMSNKWLLTHEEIKALFENYDDNRFCFDVVDTIAQAQLRKVAKKLLPDGPTFINTEIWYSLMKETGL